MKNILFFLLFFSFSAAAQNVAPFVDFNGYFKSFKSGFFRQIEFQPIKGFKAGDDVVAYIDTRGNLRVFDGEKVQDISNIPSEYKVSDHLMTWKIGPTLNMWDAGKKSTLTYFANQYVVRDSIIVYQDERLNTVRTYYNGENYDLFTSTGELSMPTHIGENIVAFKDNGNFYKVFWKGDIYELDVWHTEIDFSCGTDIIAFNDPIAGTFAIFEEGQFLDLEDFYVNRYVAGRGFVVYENQNNDLMYYENGETKKLTNFGASFWKVVDDVVIWGENGYTFAHQNGKTVEIARYIPKDYRLKNNIVAFRNIMGGVDALIDGKLVTVANQTNANYQIFGNSILIKLFNNSYLMYQNGKSYRQ